MYNRLRANPIDFNPLDLNQWEWIVDDEAPDEDTMSVEHGVATMSGYLNDHAALWDAVAYFVGYSQVAGSTTILHRSPPAVHPRWPFFRCTTVSVKGVEYDGTVNPDGIYAGIRYMRLPKYKRYRFDCNFEQPQMDFRTDAEVTSEWERMLTVEAADDGETIVVDGGTFTYRSPSGGAINARPVNIHGPYLKVYAQRSTLTITAYGIPAEWVMDQYGIPTTFLAARGKVNGVEFLGLPAGTMLFQGWDFVKRAQPIATNSLSTLVFGLDIKMTFSFTDPARADALETLRGWNLVPGAASPGSSGWYGVQDKNSGATLYDGYNMYRLLWQVGS